MVEILLRYFLDAVEEPKEWGELRPRLRATLLKNSLSVTTGKTPNEAAYGFTPNQRADLATSKVLSALEPCAIRIEISDAISNFLGMLAM